MVLEFFLLIYFVALLFELVSLFRLICGVAMSFVICLLSCGFSFACLLELLITVAVVFTCLMLFGYFVGGVGFVCWLVV